MTKQAEKTIIIVLVHLLIILSAVSYLIYPLSPASVKYVDVRFGGMADVRTFIQPMKVKELPDTPTIEQIYDLLEEKGYHYTPDSFTLFGNGATITNSYDFWCYAKETLSFWRQNKYNLYVDCECGSIFLCSLLRGYGYDARVFVGTVEIDYQTYGHAWVEVRQNNKWYLLESTYGEKLTEMKTRPDFYHPDYSFTDANVRYLTISGTTQTYENIPPDRIRQLRELLKNF